VTLYDETHNMDFQPTLERPHNGGIWLAMLREDGFVSLEAEAEGEFWTQPATFEGSRLLINSWGVTGGQVKIEITDERGKAFPGYALEDCNPLEGEQLWSAMTWTGNSDVSGLRGKLIRLRFELHRIRLYAFRFI
jgi:hypothetical protein